MGVKTKICGISTPEALRAAMDGGAGWVGFVFFPRSPRNIAVEAAVQLGWERFIGRDGIFVGMKGFGASAPQDRLFKEFGITTDAIVEAAKKAVGGA